MGDDKKTAAPEALRKDVEGFDHSKLKHDDASKASVDGATPSQARDMTMAAIQNHRPGSLKKTETIEKSILPGQDEIEAEKKRASVSDDK